jgi:uncharacterized protein (TIGR02421 family)
LPHFDGYRHALDSIDVEAAEHPVLRHLFTALWRNLSLRLDMLQVRGSSGFLAASLEVYGHVEPALLEGAENILAMTTTVSPGGSEVLRGEALAQCFQSELDYYRKIEPTLTSVIRLRDDTVGLVVTNGDLLIGSSLAMYEDDARIVAHHEIGVHILTHVNGSAQPLRVLGTGLARYHELQEALGLVSEYLAGGLRPSRLRILAARVLAARYLGDDVDFASSFDRLREAGLTPAAAFTTAMRARRGGGLTKDAIYLRGLGHLLDHVRSNTLLTSIWLGKVSLEDLPLIEDLLEQGLLDRPRLTPRVLGLPGTDAHMQALEQGIALTALGGIGP